MMFYKAVLIQVFVFISIYFIPAYAIAEQRQLSKPAGTLFIALDKAGTNHLCRANGRQKGKSVIKDLVALERKAIKSLKRKSKGAARAALKQRDHELKSYQRYLQKTAVKACKSASGMPEVTPGEVGSRLSCSQTDLNNDRMTDLADLSIVLAQFGITGGQEDINGDGIVDHSDLAILLENFGCIVPPPQ